MNSLPGMTIYSPADPIETRLALDSSTSIKTPKYFRLGKSGESNVFTSTQSNFPDWTPLANGERLLLLTTGAITAEAFKAVQTLQQDGINVSLCAIPVLKPFQFDKEYIQNFKHVLVVEEHSISGGLGSIVSEQIALNGISINLVKLGLPDLIHHEIGSQEYLRFFFGIDTKGIVNKIKEILEY
jgi:transketolase